MKTIFISLCIFLSVFCLNAQESRYFTVDKKELLTFLIPKDEMKLAPVINRLPRFLTYNRLNVWGAGRELPAFAKESFTQMWKTGKVKKLPNP